MLHDVHWPGRQFANIDHIVVGPSGVFVIDSKNWEGQVDVRQGVFRHNGRRREREIAGRRGRKRSWPLLSQGWTHGWSIRSCA